MGGGSNRQTTETNQIIAPGLEGAYRAAGGLGEDLIGQIGSILPGYLQDTSVQGVAGPTGLQNAAAGAQAGLLQGQGPQAWSDALGMFNSLGSLPQWGGVDLSGITGWGAQPTSAPWSDPRVAPVGPSRMAPQQATAAKSMRMQDGMGGSGGGGEPPGPGPAPAPDPTGSGGFDPTGGGQPVGGGAAPSVGTPEATATPWTQAAGGHGISAPGMGQGPQTGQIREISAAYQGGGGGYGGGGGFSSSGGGGGSVMDRIDNPLQNIDFANHPALQSALETFATTALPGIENSMIGAGLGRSGAAGNAIATGKANIALPVMQQLISGELQNKGFDVTQRGQDVNQQIAGAQTAAGQYNANLAHQAALRGQDIGLRGQDIGLRQMDMNALLQQGAQGLQARGQDINALLSGAQGLSSLGGMDLGRIQDAISGSMGIGGEFRGIENQMSEAEFLASQRPGERGMDIFNTLLGGAMGSGGSRTVTTGGGGGK